MNERKTERVSGTFPSENLPENRISEDLSHYLVDTLQKSDLHADAVTLHCHDYYQLIYCRSSQGMVYWDGDALYPLRFGDILLIPPQVRHCAILPESMQEPFVRDLIYFTPGFLLKYSGICPANLFCDRIQLLHTARSPLEYLGYLFLNGVEERKKQLPDWDRVVAANTAQLLCLIHRALVSQGMPVPRPNRPSLLLQIMDHIERNLSEKITLEGTAREFLVSKSTVSQLFRKEIGLSFYAYVIRRRLIAARVLIRRGIPLSEVGKQVGFADHPAFYRAFKQKYGISPKEYRDQLNRT